MALLVLALVVLLVVLLCPARWLGLEQWADQAGLRLREWVARHLARRS